MQIIECSLGHAGSWDKYVDAHPEGSMFHLFGWQRVLSESLGHQTYYLAAEQDGVICGVLPLVHIRSRLFGNSLSSLAFCTNAGPLANDNDIALALVAKAVSIAHTIGVGALELRLRRPLSETRPVKRLYDTFQKRILATPEQNMEAIRGKQRNVIKKGIKNSLVGKADTLDRFYKVYSESVRNLGTPVFPKKLFAALLTCFPQQTEIFSAQLEGNAISSALNFYYRESVCPYYWGGTSAARELKGNDFLAWSIMLRAAERGCTVFDFGRSKQGTGAYQWKENLGFEPVPLFYEYELIRDAEMPNINPMNPKYHLLIEGWKRLPLPVAEAIGPLLSRYLG